MNNITTSEINSLHLVGNNRNIDPHTNLYHVVVNKSYNAVSNCIFEHVMCSSVLTTLEQLYYLLVTHLSLINYNNYGNRHYALSAKSWAKLLNCSRSQIFVLQQSLVEKGYFIITKNQNEKTQDKRNLITPILPNSIFEQLLMTSNRYNLKQDRCLYQAKFDLKNIQLEYLDKTKSFIPLNYQLLATVTSNEELSPLHKVVWLDLYVACYKYHKSTNNKSCFSCIITYQELMNRYKISKSVLSKTLKTLQTYGFITKNRTFTKHSTDTLQEDRKDKSLWQISVTVPQKDLEILSNLKDRSSLIDKNKKCTSDINTQKENTDLKPDFNSTSNIHYLDKQSGRNSYIGSYSSFKEDIKELIRFFLGAKDQSDLNEVILELEQQDNNSQKQINFETSSNQYNKINFSSSDYLAQDKVIDSCLNQDNKVSRTDSEISKSGLHINKYLKTKIENIKSNLWGKPKVIFNDFLKELFINSDSDLISCITSKTSDNSSKPTPQNQTKTQDKSQFKEFNIHSELIREKLKLLPKDKATKARKFAYSLISKGLACGYAASLTKNELAKELIFHAATWKPTKFGTITHEQEIDTALSVAWKAIVSGKWQAPLELAKAQVLEYEFKHYRQKYQESGVISNELSSLESATNKLLKTGFTDLRGKIIEYAGVIAASSNENMLPKTRTIEDGNGGNDHNTSLDHRPNIEFPAYPEDQEYYLSYGYRDHSYIDNDINGHGEGLAVKTEYGDTDNIGKNQGEQDAFTNQILDLSAIPEKQKYLKVNCLEKNNEMIIKTVGDTEYLFKLKTMEVNDEGDTVMTLKHVKLKSFVEEASEDLFTHRQFIESRNNFSLSADNKNLDLYLKSNQITHDQHNATESCKNDIDCIQEKLQGFNGLDKAIDGIFDRLLCVKSSGGAF